MTMHCRTQGSSADDASYHLTVNDHVHRITILCDALGGLYGEFGGERVLTTIGKLSRLTSPSHINSAALQNCSARIQMWPQYHQLKIVKSMAPLTFGLDPYKSIGWIGFHEN